MTDTYSKGETVYKASSLRNLKNSGEGTERQHHIREFARTCSIFSHLPLTSASILLSSIDDLTHRRLQDEPLRVPRLPAQPRRAPATHGLHGHDVIEPNFNRTTGMLKRDRLVRRRLAKSPRDPKPHRRVHHGARAHLFLKKPTLARTSRDTFVLLVSDAASHPGVMYLSPLRPFPESIPLNSSSRADAVPRAHAVHYA
jgi:hypothetical protein